MKIINSPSLYSSLYAVADFCKSHKDEVLNIVVPDKLSLFMEKFLFEQLNISSSFNLKVSTLNRFARKCVYFDPNKQLSKTASVLKIYKIMNQHFEEFLTIKSKAYSFSYAENILRTIMQLKASKISWQEMNDFKSGNIQLQDKIHDLAKIFEYYETEKAGLLDGSDLFLLSSQFVGKQHKDETILFAGFDDFTAIEYSIIEQLSNSCDVYVFVCNSDGKNKYIYNKEIEEQLRNIAYLNQQIFDVSRFDNSNSDLKHFLESNLFTQGKDKFVLNNQTVEIFEGNLTRAEIEYVARDIRRKIINGAYYSDFGVACFEEESFDNDIKEIFSKYELNCYYDNEIDVNNSVFYKFLRSLFKYSQESYNLSHLIDIIISPFFEFDYNAKTKLVDRLVKYNFKGKFSKDYYCEPDLFEIKQRLVEFLSFLDFKKDDNAKTVLEKIKLANINFQFDNILEKLSQEEGNLQNKILLKNCYDVVLNIFEEIESSTNANSLDDVCDLFIGMASVTKVKNLPLNIDAIKIIDANDTTEIFKNFYVINCTNMVAPSTKYDCGIILDGEIDQLDFKHKLAPTIAHINRLGKLRLFNTVLMFEQSLVLTYSKNPSEIIEELKKKLVVNTDYGNMNLEPFRQDKKENFVALSKWDYLQKICKNRKNQEIIQKNNENIVNFKEISKLNSNSLQIYNNSNSMSASKLENYFKCPFMAFVGDVLKIRPRFDSEILSSDVGNMLHEILFKYYKLNKNVGDVYEFCKKEIFDFVDKDERLKQNLDSPILKNLIDEAVRVIYGMNYIDQNSSFVPLKNMFEHGFFGDKALKLKNINIVGKIDRVDGFEGMLRVVDYKSGKANPSLKELYYGNKLQLFLYSIAVEKELHKKVVGSFYLPLHNSYEKLDGNPYSLKGFYINEDFVVKAFDNRLVAGMKSDIVNVNMTSSGKARKTRGYKELESNQMDELKNYATMVSEKAVDEIRSGYIRPVPCELSSPCEYCPYSQICLKDANQIEARQTKDVNLTSFEEEENA